MPGNFSSPLTNDVDDRVVPAGHAPTVQPGRESGDAVPGSRAPARLLGWQTALEALVTEGDGHAV